MLNVLERKSSLYWNPRAPLLLPAPQPPPIPLLNLSEGSFNDVKNFSGIIIPNKPDEVRCNELDQTHFDANIHTILKIHPAYANFHNSSRA